MKSRSILTRRSFLKISAVAGSGLTLGFILEGCEADGSTTDTQAPAALLPTVVPPTAVPESRFTPNAYLAIDSTGAVTIQLHRSEMGQGIRTALPMIVAEELEADWSTIRLEPAPADPAYGDQVTGGSLSIQQSYVPLRRVGATARMMLVAAAAQTWGVAPESCYAAQGFVIHRPSGRKLTYGELAATAATLPVPQDAPLKDAADFRIIGTQPEQLDDTAIVTGRAIYGMDVRVPGLLYATVARCPVFGGHVATFDAAPAKSISGVRDVVQIDSGVAVVADSTWAAIQGRQALTISWEEGPNADLDSAHIRDLLVEQAEKVAGSDNKGSATRFVDAIYELPYLAHAPMEPMNCLAEVRSNGCTIWAPTQDRQAAQFEARRVAGSLPVAVQVPLIGGGFGRRLDVDYVPEAVQLARAVGAPVQVIWTREDDIQHDRYRPTSYHIVRGGLDAQGMPVTWRHIIASQGIAGSQDITAGAVSLPYRFTQTVRTATPHVPIPTGYWRAVYNTQNAYVNECFLDELAAAGGRDPYELRLTLLSNPRRAVLQLAATKAGWGAPLPAGWGRGIACHSTWGVSHVAQVAEVSVSPEGVIKVQRVICAIDCGLVINPDIVAAQMEGGIAFGLSAALTGEITVAGGRVVQSNFHDYPVLRIDEMPTVEVHIVPSDDAPRGVGEMAVPPIAPAVANAIFAATGKRIRRLPLRREDVSA